MIWESQPQERSSVGAYLCLSRAHPALRMARLSNRGDLQIAGQHSRSPDGCTHVPLSLTIRLCMAQRAILPPNGVVTRMQLQLLKRALKGMASRGAMGSLSAWTHSTGILMSGTRSALEEPA